MPYALSVDIIPWQIHVSYFQSLLIPKKEDTMCLKTSIVVSFQKRKVRKPNVHPKGRINTAATSGECEAASASGTTRHRGNKWQAHDLLSEIKILHHALASG